jgi:hypothetical protein
MNTEPRRKWENRTVVSLGGEALAGSLGIYAENQDVAIPELGVKDWEAHVGNQPSMFD